MSIDLQPAGTPAYLKMGVFGHTGTGKTYTVARVLSQFIREFRPDSQLAMFDTEGGAEYIAPMVLEVSGKPLLVIHSPGFAELIQFADLVRERGFVAFCDSITHPWRDLCDKFLAAKQSRAKGGGGNPDRVSIGLKDWGKIKGMWERFALKFKYDPVHWAICGREGDVWREREDEEGNKELYKAGEKMKTETEMGYEPSLLLRMELVPSGGKYVHRATAFKDRFGMLTGQSCDDPDIEFFRPYIERLSLGGNAVKPQETAGEIFPHAVDGPNWETILKQRAAVLEGIKDDITLAFPGQTAKEKQQKIRVLRAAFGEGVSWAELEGDTRVWTPEALSQGRYRLKDVLAREEN